MYSLVGVGGLEDVEYSPEAEFFVLFAEGSGKHAPHLGSSFNNLHAFSNGKGSCMSWGGV